MKIKHIKWSKSIWRTLRNNPENCDLEIYIQISEEEINELNLKDLNLINEVIQEIGDK